MIWAILIISAIIFVMWALAGGFMTWLMGKMLHMEGLTFLNSTFLQVLITILNPCLPLAVFLMDYYAGTNLATADSFNPGKTFLILLVGAGITIYLWFYLYKYLFNWELKETCIFVLLRSCLGMLIVFGAGFLMVVLPMANIAQKRAEEKKSNPFGEVGTVEEPATEPRYAPGPSTPAPSSPPPPSRSPNPRDERHGTLRPREKQNPDSGVINPLQPGGGR